MKPHRNIRILTWFNFFTDFQPYAAVLVLYFARVTGSYVNALGLYSLMTVTRAVAELPTGIFSDRIGRKNTVIWGAACATAAFSLYALGHTWSLVAGAIMAGISDSFYSGNNDALLHDSLHEDGQTEDYAHHKGRLTAIFQLSLAISAILGGLIANRSFAILMWISVIPQVICLVLATRLSEPKIRTEVRDSSLLYDLKIAGKEFWGNERLRLLNIASILEGAVGEATYRFQAAFFASLLPIWAIGFVRAAINAVAYISFHFSGRVIKRYGEENTAFTTDLALRGLNMIAYGMPSLASPFLIMLTSVPFGIGATAISALYQKEYKPEVRATMGSLNSLVGSLMFALVAFIMGLMADHFTPAKAVFIFQIVLIPTAFAYIMLKRKPHALQGK